ncbi:MAG: TIGR03086 family metal-binding protein [Acidimicrobiales bacterium]
MTSRADVVFLDGLGYFGGAVSRLRGSDWSRPSPCSGWRALDVLGHVGSAVRFGTKLLRDDDPAWAPVDPPGSAVVGDPGSWWEALVDAAREAVGGVDLSRVVDSPAGRRSIAEGLSFPALDLFVHAWDLGRVAGTDVEIPAAVIEFAHFVIDPVPVDQLRGPQVFAAEVTPPPDATATEAFIAWTGRDPRWAPVSDAR